MILLLPPRKLSNLPKAYTTSKWQNNLAPELKNLVVVVSMKTKLKALERLGEDDTHNHSTNSTLYVKVAIDNK